MAWFFSRRPQRQKRRAGRPYPDAHRSPGLALLFELLERRPAKAILDMGPSSTESLSFLSEHCESLVVQDAFHSSAKSGQRSELFRFESAASISLPPSPADGGERFDVVLLWDLLHYVPRSERAALARRIETRLAENALLMIVASSVAPIPPSPIHFKVLAKDRVDYHFDDEHLLPAYGLTTREVETTMAGFDPIRLFQLRNGYQEVVFQWQGRPEAEQGEESGESDPLPKSTDSGRHLIVFGDLGETTAEKADEEAEGEKEGAPSPDAAEGEGDSTSEAVEARGADAAVSSTEGSDSTGVSGAGKSEQKTAAPGPRHQPGKKKSSSSRSRKRRRRR